MPHISEIRQKSVEGGIQRRDYNFPKTFIFYTAYNKHCSIVVLKLYEYTNKTVTAVVPQ